jgi:hypothetical protein
MGTVFEVETALGYTVSNRNSRHKTPGATSSSTSPSTPSSGGLSCLKTNSATRSRSPVVYACRQQQLELDWSSICRLERCEHMPFRRRLADLFLTSKAYSKAGGSLLRSTSGASADGRQIGLMMHDRAPQHAWCNSRVLLQSCQAHRRSARPLHLRHLA